MKNGRKNRNSKAWSACGSWDKKKNDEKLVTATRALSMCSSGFWLFRNERRRSGSIEPIHPRRPRECSSNRLSTTLQSDNLIIHTGRMNEENKDAKVLRERTILISMGSVFFFRRCPFLEIEIVILRWKTEEDDFDGLCRSVGKLEREFENRSIQGESKKRRDNFRRKGWF